MLEKYQLMNGFKAVKANQKEFAKYHTIYKLGNSNVWFPSTMKHCMDLYAGFPNAYWLYLNDQRVGGAIIEPNWFGLYFLISPYEDEFTLLSEILNLVRSLSDKTKPIIAYGIHEQSKPVLQRYGFQVWETEKMMICPTKSYKVTWPEDVYLDIPNQENLKEIIDLYHDVYSKSVVPSIKRRDYHYYENLVNEQIGELENDYCTLIYDKKTDELVGACLVSIWQEYPFILDIVVKSSHQNQGLGGWMIKKVLNNTKDQYEAVRLSVNPGNKAEMLYHKLGFISGVATSTMKLELDTKKDG